MRVIKNKTVQIGYFGPCIKVKRIEYHPKAVCILDMHNKWTSYGKSIFLAFR